MRRAGMLAVGVAAAGVAAAATWSALATGSDRDGDESARRPTGTATVTRRDLVARDTFAGTLGYADARSLASPVSGTVTWLPREGQIVRRGAVVLRVDAKPVVLLYGSYPLWRTLSLGVEGQDVRQLERNLVELGYDPDGEIDVDGDFDSATQAAVLRWQEDLGVSEDGSIAPEEAMFLPGPRRIGTLDAAVGARVVQGASALETSSTRRLVTVDLDARRQTLVRKGQSVRIELPSGRVVRGRILEVGKVAKTAADGEGTPTIEVTIGVHDARATGNLDQAPVDVAITREIRRNVLTVPVGALLALAGGGYAVEVVAGEQTKLVRVEPGLFADGLVEIAGAVEDGTKVVVPR